eukprot:Colp12_sorted_trinity150504_noHs@15915
MYTHRHNVQFSRALSIALRSQLACTLSLLHIHMHSVVHFLQCGAHQNDTSILKILGFYWVHQSLDILLPQLLAKHKTITVSSAGSCNLLVDGLKVPKTYKPIFSVLQDTCKKHVYVLWCAVRSNQSNNPSNWWKLITT